MVLKGKWVSVENPFRLLGIKLIYWVLGITTCLHIALAAWAGNVLQADETYYVPAAIDMLHGIPYNFEHPPLVKWIIAGSIAVLGNSWVAWRLPIIAFSVLATFLTYKVAMQFVSENAAVFSAIVLTLSIVFMFEGSMALLDVPAISFGLLGLFWVLRSHYALSGLAFGLSFLCKELGLILAVVALIYLLYVKAKPIYIFFSSMIFILVSYCGVWLYDAVYKPMSANLVISNPLEQLWYMIQYQLTLNGRRVSLVNGEIQNGRVTSIVPPIAWVTPFGHDAFYNFILQSSAAVEYFMFPLLVILPILYWKRKDALALLSWAWLVLNFLPWLIVGLVVKTQSNFYIDFSVPFLAIGSAYLWTSIKEQRLRYLCAYIQFAVGVAWFVFFLVIVPLVLK